MRYITLRLISCLCVVTAWYFDVWWLAIPLLLWHCYHYRAIECILLGMCIDIQFMNHIGVPWYTVGATLAVLFAEGVKPMLRHDSRGFTL